MSGFQMFNFVEDGWASDIKALTPYLQCRLTLFKPSAGIPRNRCFYPARARFSPDFIQYFFVFNGFSVPGYPHRKRRAFPFRPVKQPAGL
jgi:hypothetical protein